MKKIKISYLVLLLMIVLFISGCNDRADVRGSSQEAYHVLNQLHDTLSYQSFAFDGSTSLKGENFNANNIANFTGFLDKDRDLYLNLTTAKEENGIMEDMDYYAKGNRLYMRFADQVNWQPVAARSPLIEDELNHWNPVAHFGRISELAQSIRHLGRLGKHNIESIRVVLQPEKLKNEFLQNINDRQQNPYISRLRINTESLSTGIAGEKGILQELNAIQKTIQKEFKEVANTVSLRGEYIINYDARHKIPTNLTYIQTTEYTEGGERHTETSKMRMTFRDFGKDLKLKETFDRK